MMVESARRYSNLLHVGEPQTQKFPLPGQIRPWCSVGMAGGLSFDEFRAGRMSRTVKEGLKPGLGRGNFL
jgi:hypothetical protein